MIWNDMIRYDMMGCDSDIKLVQIRNMQKKKKYYPWRDHSCTLSKGLKL